MAEKTKVLQHSKTTTTTTTQETVAAPPPGYRLPPPDEQPPAAAPATAPPATSATTQPTAALPAELPADGKTDASSRDWAIGGGILLVLVVVYFILKNAHANRLVSNKIPPSTANLSGWWLFTGLTLLSAAGMLAVVDGDKFLTPLYMAPLLIVALIALVSTWLTSRR
ncbi:MAG: hypothetical protein ACKN9T_18140 [Candidatus Methylumidiphilus sp.]